MKNLFWRWVNGKLAAICLSLKEAAQFQIIVTSQGTGISLLQQCLRRIQWLIQTALGHYSGIFEAGLHKDRDLF